MHLFPFVVFPSVSQYLSLFVPSRQVCTLNSKKGGNRSQTRTDTILTRISRVQDVQKLFHRPKRGIDQAFQFYLHHPPRRALVPATPYGYSLALSFQQTCNVDGFVH